MCSFLDDAFRKNLESALRFGNPLLVQVSLKYIVHNCMSAFWHAGNLEIRQMGFWHPNAWRRAHGSDCNLSHTHTHTHTHICMLAKPQYQLEGRAARQADIEKEVAIFSFLMGLAYHVCCFSFSLFCYKSLQAQVLHSANITCVPHFDQLKDVPWSLIQYRTLTFTWQ